VNTESVDCRKVKHAQGPEDGGMEKPGDFCFSEDLNTLYIWIPGMSGPDAIRVQKGQPGGSRVWGWDGNEDKPTLTPSIHAPNHRQGSGCLISGG
jgi:hypothetical protein